MITELLEFFTYCRHYIFTRHSLSILSLEIQNLKCSRQNFLNTAVMPQVQIPHVIARVRFQAKHRRHHKNRMKWPAGCAYKVQMNFTFRLGFCPQDTSLQTCTYWEIPPKFKIWNTSSPKHFRQGMPNLHVLYKHFLLFWELSPLIWTWHQGISQRSTCWEPGPQCGCLRDGIVKRRPEESNGFNVHDWVNGVSRVYQRLWHLVSSLKNGLFEKELISLASCLSVWHTETHSAITPYHHAVM